MFVFTDGEDKKWHLISEEDIGGYMVDVSLCGMGSYENRVDEIRDFDGLEALDVDLCGTCRKIVE